MTYDDKTLTVFLTHSKPTDIAKALNISRTSVYKLLKNPDFQKALQECKQHMLKSAINRMSGGLDGAVTVLLSIIHAEDVAPQTRLNAVSTLLIQYREMVQTQEFSERLEALERTVADNR